MKIRISKIMSAVVSCVVASTVLIPQGTMKAHAICCRKDGFDKSRYTLTGNMAEDAATIAKSQKGRFCDDFGYSGVDWGAWCDEYVADCLENAGCDSSIVAHGGTVADFAYAMRQRGAVQVSTPQTGDLVFFTYSHVEIVTKVENGVVYSAGGNNNDPNTHSYHDGGCCAGEHKTSNISFYLRPKYKGGKIEPPTYAKLEKSQVWYDLQDTIELIPSSDNAAEYWISIKKDDTVVISDHINGGDTYKFSANQYGAGNYYAWVSAANSAGSIDSNGVDFAIVDGVGYSGMSSSKSAYSINDDVSISVDTICAKGQVVGIDKINSGRVITENCDSTFSVPARELGTGLYGAYFSVYNGSESVDTKWDFFSIDNETSKPESVSLAKNQYWYDIKDTITLSPSSTNAQVYWICIRKNDVDIINTKIIGDYSFKADDYGYGEYYAWVSAVNSCGSTDSEGVSFSVVDGATYTDVYSAQSIYGLDDMVSLSVDTVCAKGQVIGIDKEGEGRIITEECDSTYKIQASDLGEGQYSAYFSVYNGSGGVDTKRIDFKIMELSNIVGDCNNDGTFNISDVVLLQKWLLAVPDTHIENWKAADMCEDDKLDVFDLCLMKRQLINNNDSR